MIGMKKILPLILKYGIAFGIAGFFIWLSLKDIKPQDKHDIMQALLHAKFLLLLPVFALMLLSHLFRALRWKQLIEPMGYKPPVFDLLCGILLGYLANQFIPRAGEIARCTIVGRQQKIPVEKLIGTILAERAFDLLCLLMMAVSAFFLQYGYLSGYAGEIVHKLGGNLHNKGQSFWLIASSICVLGIILIIYLVKKPKRKTQSVFARIFRGLGEGFGSIKRVNSKWAFLSYTGLMWLCYVLSTWLGCFALVETQHLGISTGVALLVFGTFGIIVAPGGLGAYPYAIQKTLLLYNINENIAIASGWLLMLAQVVFVLIFGTLAYFAVKWRNRYYEKHRISST